MKKEKVKKAKKLFYSEINPTNILKLVNLIDEIFCDDENYPYHKKKLTKSREQINKKVNK